MERRTTKSAIPSWVMPFSVGSETGNNICRSKRYSRPCSSKSHPLMDRAHNASGKHLRLRQAKPRWGSLEIREGRLANDRQGWIRACCPWVRYRLVNSVEIPSRRQVRQSCVGRKRNVGELQECHLRVEGVCPHCCVTCRSEIIPMGKELGLFVTCPSGNSNGLLDPDRKSRGVERPLS